MNDLTILKIGDPYFTIVFYDGAGTIPKIETLIYVGKNIHKSDQGDVWYFQNPETYCSFGAFNTLPPGDYDVYRLDAKELEMIYEASDLSKRLLDPFYDY